MRVFYKTLVFVFLFIAILGSQIAYSQQDRKLLDAYLNAQKDKNEWLSDDISDLKTTDAYTDKSSGTSYWYLQQNFKGIPVFNAISVVLIKDAKLVHFTPGIISKISLKANSETPQITPKEAIEASLKHLGKLNATIIPSVENNAQSKKYLFDVPEFSNEPVSVELYWVVSGKTVKLAWNVSIEMKGESHWWNLRIDAENGNFIEKNDFVTNCKFEADGSNKSHDHGACLSENKANLNTTLAPPPSGFGDYRVYALPVEAPSFGGRTLLTNPADPTASPFGWHDTNGSAGAEFTITRGNNAFAYEDQNSDNLPGFSPDGTASLEFDFPYDSTLAPTGNMNASLTNLFYMSNRIHDYLYFFGFNEVAGNFQTNNYGNGGAGNDAVRAEGFDGSGTNNANFLTPADGSAPRMQMFLWTAPTPDRDGSFDNGIIAHEYGHGVSTRLTGGPSNSSCLGNQEQGGEGWSDWLSLMMSIEPGDIGPGFLSQARGIGTYALDQATNGPGIRTFRYSVDMSINPQTYANLPTAVVPHGVGELLCDALWDMSCFIINDHGFSSDPTVATAGNNIAMKLVLEGMKLQPCSPGFIDARNAILKADTILYGSAHSCRIWEAFARRGMGVNASQGSSNSITDQVVDFNKPVACTVFTQPPVAAFTANSFNIFCSGTINFSDFSVQPASWLWDFGDGSTSTAQNPNHFYSGPGTFNVKLKVTNPFGSDSIVHVVTVNPSVQYYIDADADGFGSADTTTLNQPINEGFTSLTTALANGWARQNLSSPVGSVANWIQGNATFTAPTGPATSYALANFNNTTGTNTISNWLFTPNVTLQDGAVLKFKTRTKTGGAFPDRLQVRMSTNGASVNAGASNTSVGDFTTLLLDINPTYATGTGYPNVFTEFSVTISGLGAPTSGRFAFRYFVENGGPSGANSDAIGIDDVTYTISLASPLTVCGTPPVGFVTNNTDCDDANNGINPTATEICNSIDDNCNASTDEGLLTTYFQDADTDTFGNPSVSETNCTGPSIGFVSNSLDCNDADANINPNSTEIANGIDDNCNELIDEIYTLSAVQCNAVMPFMTKTVFADNVLNASSYKFRVIHGVDTNFITSNLRYFQMTSIPNFQYSTSYNVSVAVSISNGPFSAFGPSCTIITPNFITQVRSSQCGQTLPGLSTVIADILPGAVEYKFRITYLGHVQEITNSNPTFSISALDSSGYNRIYVIQVAGRLNGSPSFGAFGPSCLVTSGPFPLTQIQASQCNTTVASSTSNINANSILGATQYRFRVSQGPNVQIIVRPTRVFTMSLFTGWQFGTTYNVEVGSFVNGIWSPFGPMCTITTPAAGSATTQLDGVSCNSTVSSLNQSVYAINVTNATQYEFLVENALLAYSQSAVRPSRTFRFSYLPAIPAIQMGTTYQVRVRANTGGVWGPYGNICTLTTPVAPSIGNEIEETIYTEEFAVNVFPNPFSESFTLNLNTSSEEPVIIRIFDLNGKMLSVKNLSASKAMKVALGENLAAGMYQVTVIQGDRIKTLKVIKTLK